MLRYVTVYIKYEFYIYINTLYNYGEIRKRKRDGIMTNEMVGAIKNNLNMVQYEKLNNNQDIDYKECEQVFEFGKEKPEWSIDENNIHEKQNLAAIAITPILIGVGKWALGTVAGWALCKGLDKIS